MANANTDRPRIVVLATGGTIAGRGASGADTSSYDAAVASIDDLLSSVSGIDDRAVVTGQQIAHIPSKNLTDADILMIAKRVSETVARKDVDGVVVTHGTDTIEETSYFCNLTIPTSKPIVFVGAMRPMTALSADGPINLYDAIRVAANPSSAGKGVLLVMNGEIHTARDVTKCDTSRTNAFASPFGPLGLAVEGRELFYRNPARPHTAQSDFNIAGIERLSSVQIVYSHSSVLPATVESLLDVGGLAGIVYAGTGNANIPDSLLPHLETARKNGIHVVRTSRTGGGSSLRNQDPTDARLGLIVADDQNPQKARLLLGLALTRTDDPASIQADFEKY